jgi:hypothetical protein
VQRQSDGGYGLNGPGGWTLDLSRRYASSDPGFKANAPDTEFANVSYLEHSDESSHQNLRCTSDSLCRRAPCFS